MGSGLQSIVIPSTVTSIGNNCFESSESLVSVEFESGRTTVPYSAFNSCIALSTVVLPDTITTIETLAFRNCSSLTSIIIPSSVTKISSQAFYLCSNLTTVYNLSNLEITAGSTSNGYVAYYATEVLTELPAPTWTVSDAVVISGAAFSKQVCDKDLTSVSGCDWLSFTGGTLSGTAPTVTSTTTYNVTVYSGEYSQSFTLQVIPKLAFISSPVNGAITYAE